MSILRVLSVNVISDYRLISLLVKNCYIITKNYDFIRPSLWSVFVAYLLRSSYQRCSIRKGVLKNFAKFTGKHLCQSIIINKGVGLRPAALLKKRLWHRCFPVNFAEFLRTPFFKEHLRWLLLYYIQWQCF